VIAPNGAIALRAFASFFGLRAFRRVAPEPGDWPFGRTGRGTS
jgi:hypothetical protein